MKTALPWLALISLCGVIFFLGLIGTKEIHLATHESPDRGVSLQFAGSAEKFDAILNEWDKADESSIKEENTPGWLQSVTDRREDARSAVIADFGFVVSYVAFLASLVSMIYFSFSDQAADQAKRNLFRKLAVGFVFAIVTVGILDFVENFLLLHMIGSAASGRLVLITTAIATIKIRIIFLTVAFILSVGFWRIFREKQNQELLKAAYLLRIPLLCTLFLAALPILGSIGPLTIKNAFITDDWWDPLFVGFQVLLFLFFVHFLVRLTTERLESRFDVYLDGRHRGWLILKDEISSEDEDPNFRKEFSAILKRFAPLTWILIFLLILFGAVVAWRWEPPDSAPEIFRNQGIAFVCAMFLYLAGAVSAYFFACLTVEESLNLLPGWMSSLSPLKLDAIHTAVDKFIGETVLKSMGPGYFAPSKEESVDALHVKAIVIFVLLLFVYVLSYLFLSPDQPHPWQEGKTLADLVPAICYVVGIIFLGLSFMSGISFLLDFYRVPVVTVLLILSGVSYSIFQVDHYFDVNYDQSSRISVESTSKAFEARLDRLDEISPNTPIIVVCAAGGGIQAAGWSALILEDLSHQIPYFSDSVFLISSTSGGSVGAYHYLEAENCLDKKSSSKNHPVAYLAATSSSLEETLWGFVFPDIMKITIPLLGSRDRRDRAWAAEQAWYTHGKICRGENAPATWADWVRMAEDGRMPAVIFNALKVEDGNQMKISTVDLGFPTFPRGPAWDFADLDFDSYYHRAYAVPESDVPVNELKCPDINVVTAARLSASFPVVTPFGRARPVDKDGKELKRIALPAWHLADGGYFDNSGALGAIEWLRANWVAIQNSGREVIVLNLIAFPSGDKSVPFDGSHSVNREGWNAVFLGPLTALAAVRTTTQIRRSELEIDMLKTHGADIGRSAGNEEATPITISSFTFQPVWTKDSHQPPLSWELSAADRDWIELNWKNLKKYSSIEPPGDAVDSECKSIPETQEAWEKMRRKKWPGMRENPFDQFIHKVLPAE